MLAQHLKQVITVCTPSHFGYSPCAAEPLKSWRFIVHEQMGWEIYVSLQLFLVSENNKSKQEILWAKMKTIKIKTSQLQSHVSLNKKCRV